VSRAREYSTHIKHGEMLEPVKRAVPKAGKIKLGLSVGKCETEVMNYKR